MLLLAEIFNETLFFMSKYILTHFGEIDSDDLDEYYETELTVNGREVEVDINFEGKTIDLAKLNKLNEWLSNVTKLDELGLATVQEDFKIGETVKEYIEHHIEELDSDDLKALLKGAKQGTTKEEKLLSTIRLKRIGFYPHTDERFVNLDYTLDEDLTDYLVVLDFTEDGKLHYITLES
jgi:hypothetical protein